MNTANRPMAATCDGAHVLHWTPDTVNAYQVFHRANLSIKRRRGQLQRRHRRLNQVIDNTAAKIDAAMRKGTR